MPTYNFTGDVRFKELLIGILEKNELNGLSPYALRWAGTPESGWSFSVVQYDLGQRGTTKARDIFASVLLNAKDSNGNYIIDDGDPNTGRGTPTSIEDTKVSDLYTKSQTLGGTGLTTEEKTLINRALRSDAGKSIIDQSYNKYFDDVLFPDADDIINAATGVDATFLQDDLGRLFVCDFCNQYGDQNKALLKDFVAGQSVITQAGGVIIKQGNLGVDDLLNFYFRTNNAAKYPWDPMRRFSNVAAAAGLTQGDLDLDTAKGILRAYTYLYVRKENILTQNQKYLVSVNAFRSIVTHPANQVILSNWQPEWGTCPSLDNINDILMGDDNDNKSTTGDYQLNGRDGNDVIFGEGGDDEIKGGVGNDTLIGGEGIDHLYGDDNDDVLYGGIGNDTLDGDTGIDVMIGGVGNDTYKVNESTDVIVEKAGEDEGKEDLVQSTAATYTLPDNVENLTLMGTDNIDGTGNELPNVITGNTGDNKLDGGGGNDTLEGGGGNNVMDGGADDDILDGSMDDVDILWGDAGKDTLYGGTGDNNNLSGGANDDILYGANGDDFLYGEADNDLIYGGGGNDIIEGGAGNDTIYGEANDDKIDGGSGNDVLYSGGGNKDTLLIALAKTMYNGKRRNLTPKDFETLRRAA